MDITLQPATKADTEFARSVHHRAYHNAVVTQFGTWDENAQDGFFETEWSQPGHEIVLWHGTPCGYARYERLASEIQAHELVLLPEFQGKGIGSFLLRKMLAEGTDRHVPVTLKVLQRNRAFELYTKLGFKEIGRTDTHVLMKWTPGV